MGVSGFFFNQPPTIRRKQAHKICYLLCKLPPLVSVAHFKTTGFELAKDRVGNDVLPLLNGFLS